VGRRSGDVAYSNGAGQEPGPYAQATREGARLRLSAGSFGIFFPCDAHLPKVHDGCHEGVFKVVIKIRVGGQS
jgi:beta-galactosidase beta subunit